MSHLEPLTRSARPSDDSPDGAGHLVQFYESDATITAAVSRFLGAALAAGQGALAIATPAHVDAIAGALQANGFDVERARGSGQLELVDTDDALRRFLVRGAPDWDLFADQIGGMVARSIAISGAGKARAYGEMVDVLWRRGERQAALRLEEFWDRLCEEHPFSLLCGYVMGNFYKESDAAAFDHVCALHQQVFPAPPARNQNGAAAPSNEIARLQQRALALQTELLHRKELEEALRCAREQAEAASRAKDEFLAMLGHELRNPLAPILTALELMKLRAHGVASREQQVIERQARHLARLVDDLLDISRITRRTLDLQRDPVDLRDVLAKATERASPLIESRQHQLEVVAPSRGQLVVNGEEGRLAQVFANLLTNAAKYTPVGGHVRVRAFGDGREAVVEVSDDGAGIEPELLPRVFDLFVQGRQGADRHSGGLGVGLPLVRSLVTLHGGSVSAQSDGPGRGSVFTIRLPLLRSGADEGAASDTDGARASSTASSARRILLVEDNQDALEMLADVLRGAGHEVRAAADGPTALEGIEDFQPELAILDIGLPAMDGYDLASRLRTQLGKNAPVLVALTGYGQDSDRARSEAAGFELHLLKPVEARELLLAIDHRLERVERIGPVR